MRFQSRAIKSKHLGVRARRDRHVVGRDHPRGPIRAHLMTIALDTPGLAVDYAYAGVVRRTAPLTRILARHQAIGGVNGDFFDIGDTGAPLGLGLDRQEGLLNARSDGWNAAFYVDKAGLPQIGTVPMVARYKQHPNLPITTRQLPRGGARRHRRLHPAPGATPRATASPAARPRTCGWCGSSRAASSRPSRGCLPASRSKASCSSAAARAPRSWPGSSKGTKATVRWWLKNTAEDGDHRQQDPDQRRPDRGGRRPRDAPAHRDRHRPRAPTSCCCWSSTAASRSAAATRWSSWPTG